MDVGVCKAVWTDAWVVEGKGKPGKGELGLGLTIVCCDGWGGVCAMDDEGDHRRVRSGTRPTRTCLHAWEGA